MNRFWELVVYGFGCFFCGVYRKEIAAGLVKGYNWLKSKRQK